MRRTPGADSGMCRLGGQLDVVWVEVAAADDDLVLEPSDDVQFVVDHGPEIARV